MKKVINKSKCSVILVKLMFFLFAVCLFTKSNAIGNINVNAYEEDNDGMEGDLYYSVLGNEVKIISYEGNEKSVIIPDTINGYEVTMIGRKAFYGSDIEKIIFSQKLKSIGDGAFQNCTKLTSITIPDSVTEIGYSAFSGCVNLRDIKLGSNIKTIDGFAFSDCTDLTSIVIPDSVTSMGLTPFYNCSNLSQLTLGSGLVSGELRMNKWFDKSGSSAYHIEISNNTTIINEKVFMLCSGLTSITIPNSVKNIGKEAFKLTGLTDVIIPDSVTDIGESAFSQCENLTSVIIPDNVKNTGKWAFNHCISLKNIVVGSKNIGAAAFSGCIALTDVTILDSVNNIKDSAFYNCIALKSITIPKTVSNIGDMAIGCYNDTNDFSKGSGLNEEFIIFGISGTEAEGYAKNNGIIFKSSNVKGQIPAKGDIIKSGKDTYKVTKAGSTVAYMNTTSIASTIKIPATIKIDDIVYKVTSIAAGAFQNSKDIKKVVIGNNITTIGNNAFNGCTKLKNVTIGSKVKKIGKQAFKGCKNLATINIKSVRLISVDKDAFKGIKSNAIIKVPSEKLSDYQKLLKGKGQGGKVIITEE